MSLSRQLLPALIMAASGAVHGSAGAQSGAAAAGQTQQWPGRYPYTRADIDFVTGMISHHAQALVMARMAPTHGAGESVRILCARIINAQDDEITLMQKWLKDRNQPVPEAKPLPMKMMMGGVEHEMMMPGMLTGEQMNRLDAARGREFERLLLTFMIQHHKGAMTMVRDLLAQPGAAQDDFVHKFQADVYADQGTEIVRMQKMLLTLPPK